MKHIFLSLFFALAAFSAHTQSRIYVNHAATGANTGATWADALTDLQAALDIAQSGDEVWVAQGTYRPTPGADRSVSFAPKSGVRLIGGFAGMETDLDQRAWQAHPAVLSGDIGAPGDSTDNSYNVVYLHQPDSSTLLDGFFVRHGNADAASGSAYARNRCGGGLYVMGQDWEAYAEIRNCVFEHNTARNYGGGAMVNGSGVGSVAPRFFNCRFEQNRVVIGGGGLAYIGASWVERGAEIASCDFLRNLAGVQGGGFYFLDADRTSSMDLAHSTFIENKAGQQGGGGLCLLGKSSGSLFTLSNSIIQKNQSKNGTAFEFSPSAFEPVRAVNIDLCIIKENYNIDMIGSQSTVFINLLKADDSTMISISNNKILKNYGSNQTFFVGVDYANLIATQNIISENISKTLFDSPCKVNIFENNVFESNNLVNGSGVLRTVFSAIFTGCLYKMNIASTFKMHSVGDSIIFTGCSLINNEIVPPFLGFGPPLFFSSYNTLFRHVENIPEFTKADISSSFTHCYFDSLDCASLPPNVTCGPGMIIGGDPMFVAPDSGDYRLLACSPLVNAGSNAYVSTSTDLAGNPRIRGGTVDIGAYEHQGPALAAAPTAQPSCPGGASGGIGIEVHEACPPVAVAWQSGASSGTALSGLPPGEYQITVTDSKGLTLAFSATVPLGDPPTLAPLPTPVICGDTLGGSAAVSVSGATAPLAFDWGALGSDSLLSGLPPGLYPVTVTDARGCTAVGSVQVDRSGNLGVDITAQPVSCYGSADGSLTVLPANGKAPFAWNWSNPPGAATPTVGPLGPGTYEGTLTDAFGCTIGWVLPLGQPGPLQPSAFVTDASDTGKADGAILLIPTGGTGPYSALWAGGQTGLLLDSLPPGAYFATVTDANGCTAATPPVLVGVTTAAGEPDAPAGWQVLPNPATTEASVVLSGPAPVSLPVRLWAADGRPALERVLPAGGDRLHLRTGDLPRGMYFVQVGAAVRKVVLR